MKTPTKREFITLLGKIISSKPDMAVLSIEEIAWLRSSLDDGRTVISTGPGLPDLREHYETVLAWNQKRIINEMRAKKQLGRPKRDPIRKRRELVWKLHSRGWANKDIRIELRKKGYDVTPDVVRKDISRKDVT